MLKTRCKFSVTGVENTPQRIFKTVYEGDPDFATSSAPAYKTGDGRLYKNFDTGACAQNVHFAAVYDSSNPEDISFAEATPSGDMRIFVTNPNVIGQFKPGDNVYIDIVPVE